MAITAKPVVPHEEPKPIRDSRVWLTAHHWWDWQLAEASPSPETRRGALWGTLGTVVLFVIVDILYQPSGFGLVFDTANSILSTALVGVLIALVVALLLTLIRRLPLVGTSVILGSCVIITIGSFGQPSLRLATIVLSLCVAAAILGATIATFASQRFAMSSVVRKAFTYLACASAAGYSIGLVWTLVGNGHRENLSTWRPRAELMPTVLAASDPAAIGPYTVNTLLYGAGTDIRRPE